MNFLFDRHREGVVRYGCMAHVRRKFVEALHADSRSAKAGEKRLPQKRAPFRLGLPFKAEAPYPAGTREEGFGRGAGSCGNGRPYLSTAEQLQNVTHDG